MFSNAISYTQNPAHQNPSPCDQNVKNDSWYHPKIDTLRSAPVALYWTSKQLVFRHKKTS